MSEADEKTLLGLSWFKLSRVLSGQAEEPPGASSSVVRSTAQDPKLAQPKKTPVSTGSVASNGAPTTGDVESPASTNELDIQWTALKSEQAAIEALVQDLARQSMEVQQKRAEAEALMTLAASCWAHVTTKEDQVAEQSAWIDAAVVEIQEQRRLLARGKRPYRRQGGHQESEFRLGSLAIREWLLEHPTDLFDADVAMSGSGPFDADEFAACLSDLGFEVWQPSASTDDVGILIVGAEDFDEHAIQQHIDARDGAELRVYSQEMFLLAVAVGRDPYDSVYRDLIESMSAGHAGLDFALKAESNWPGEVVHPIPVTPLPRAHEALSPSAQPFRDALDRLIQNARRKGELELVITAGDLHRLVGGYPGPTHRMPSCCAAMRSVMGSRDEFIYQPPKGNGARLQILFRL